MSLGGTSVMSALLPSLHFSCLIRNLFNQGAFTAHYIGMKYFFSSILILAWFLFFNSCNKMPNGGVPFYLRMDSVQLTTDFTTQGARTENITDVWVEAGPSNIGAFGLPCNFPVLQENNVYFLISAGIKESGQSGVRVIYPFYQPDTFTLGANKAAQYFHTPSFRYKSGARFPFLEDFGFGNKFNNNLSLVGDTNALLVPGELVRQSGKFSVNLTDSATLVAQTNGMDLPEGQEIWLELDYKCDVPFFIGFFASDGSSTLRVPVLFITEKPYWNKVYVKFSNYIGQFNQLNTYNLYFEALRPYGSAGGSVYIDNVKMVHF